MIGNIFKGFESSHNLPIFLWLLGAFIIGFLIARWWWNRQVNSLRGEYDSLNLKYNGLQNTHGELKGSLDLKEEDLKKLSLELSTANTRIKDIEIEKGDLHTAMYKVKDALKLEEESKLALSTQYKTLDGQYGSAKGQIGDLETQIAGLKSLKAKLEGEVGDLNTSLGSAKGDLNTANLQIGGLQTRIGDLEGNLGALNTSYGASVDAKASLEGDLEGANVKIGDLEGQIGGLNATIGDLEGKIGGLNAKIGDLEGIKASLEGDLEGANLKIGGLETQVGDLEGNLGKLNASYGASVDATSGLEADLDGAKAKIGSLEGQVGDLQTEIATLESAKASLEGQVGDLNASLGTAQSNLEAANLKVGGLETQVGALGAQLESGLDTEEKATLEADLKKALDDVEFFNVAVADLEDSNKKLESEGRKANARIEVLKGKLAGLEEELGNAQTALTACTEEKAGLVLAAAPVEEVDDATKVENAKASVKAAMGSILPVATAADKDDLKVISGIGPFIENKLNGLDIYTYKQVSLFDDNLSDQVTTAIEFFPGRIQRDEWVKQAKILVGEKGNAMSASSPTDDKAAKAENAKAALANIIGTSVSTASAEDKDDLKVISGVGPFIEEKLNNLDIYTYQQVSEFDTKTVGLVEDAIEFFPGRIKRDGWVKQATELYKNKRSSSAASTLQGFIGNKITAATAADKDDLKVIKGVGPFIEQKLNGLNIFTYEQVSQFDTEIVKVVTDAIQFFPGRIERDEWARQALELFQAKSK